MDASMWNNLSKGQQIAAGGGLAALIASFLPWYSAGDQFFSYSVKGTSFGFGWMGMVLFVAAAALVIAPAFGKTIGTDQLSGEQAALIAAAVGSLMWVYRFIDTPFGISRSFGLFIALASGAAVVAGVVMTMKEKGIAMPNASNFTSSTATTDTAPTPFGAPQAAPHAAPQAAPHAAPQAAPHAAPQAAPHAAPAPAVNDTSGSIEF